MKLTQTMKSNSRYARLILPPILVCLLLFLFIGDPFSELAYLYKWLVFSSLFVSFALVRFFPNISSLFFASLVTMTTAFFWMVPKFLSENPTQPVVDTFSAVFLYGAIGFFSIFKIVLFGLLGLAAIDKVLFFTA